jgi:hypothetical protein
MKVQTILCSRAIMENEVFYIKSSMERIHIGSKFNSKLWNTTDPLEIKPEDPTQ